MKRLAILGLAAFAAFGHGANIVLWNNGGIVTHPGQGSGGADASSIQLGNLYGTGCQTSRSNQAADDFTVPANQKFRVNTLEFFLYQTNSGTTPTINSLTLRIWDGVPGGGGNVVYDSSTTNRLTAAVFTNIYRVSPTSLTSTARPVMKATATIPGGVLLDGTGTGKMFWVSWQANGTLSSGPFAVPVSILSQRGKTGANGRQFINVDAAWSAISDEGAPPGYDAPALQDLAFNLNGNQRETFGSGSYSVISGEEFTGSLAALANSDDDYVSLFNDPFSLAAVLEVVSAPTNNTTTPSLSMTVEYAADRLGLAFAIKALNKNTSVFDTLFGATAPSTDATQTIVVNNSNYVSNTGNVTLRLEWEPINDEDPSQDGWLHRVDRVNFTTEP